MKIKELLSVGILLLSIGVNAQAPSPITDLLASNTAETTTDLTWTTPAGTVTEYKVYQDAVEIATTTNTFFNVIGLTIDTSYDFTIYAYNLTEGSIVSNIETVLTLDVTSPSIVTNLSTSNITETSTDLSWDASVDNVAVTGYEVYQNINSGGDVLVASPTTNSATIGSLVIGDSNDFTVYAKDAAGNSSIAASNVVNVVTADTTPPVTITDLVASNITETTLDLTWSTTDNVGVSDYEVFQDETGVGSPVSLGLTGGIAAMNVSGLILGTSYDFTVYAQDAAGNVSLVSNTVVALTVDVTPPSNVTNLTAANTTIAQTDLSWDIATDNNAVTGYEVYQNTNSGGNVLVASPTTNSATIGSLVIGDSNDFTVYAKDAAGNSSIAASNVVNVVTADTTPPVTITDLVASNITETTLDLTWSTTDNVGVSDYEVFQDETGVGSPVSLGLTGGIAAMNVSGLILGTSYDFTVYAQDAAGNVSLVSNTVVVLTVDTTPPATVDDLTSSNITDVSASLSWTPVSDNIGVVNYEVFQDGASIGLTGGFSSYDVEELVELTIYRFKVTAIDAAGNTSPLSNVEIVETPKEAGAINYTNLNTNLISVDWKSKDFYAAGNVGIGTSPSENYKLAVDGNIIAEEVRVALKANWPDYVFEKDYDLSPLDEVEGFIKTYGHLENIPNALTAESNGISLGEMNSLLLRKIEELTLYTIQQEKKINALSKENEQLESLNKRLLKVEKLIKQLKK